MKYIKLFFISLLVFSGVLFCISLLFPAVTIVSRAVNVKAGKQEMQTKLAQLYQLVFQENCDSGTAVPASDTLLAITSFATNIKQGVALYALGNDSTAVQVFYKIQVPWYKPWKKFGLMLNEARYGPGLDSGISRIQKHDFGKGYIAF